MKDGGVSYIEHVWKYLQKEYEVNDMNSKDLFLKFSEDISEILPKVLSDFNKYFESRKKAGIPEHDPKEFVKFSDDEEIRKRLNRANAFYTK